MLEDTKIAVNSSNSLASTAEESSRPGELPSTNFPGRVDLGGISIPPAERISVATPINLAELRGPIEQRLLNLASLPELSLAESEETIVLSDAIESLQMGLRPELVDLLGHLDSTPASKRLASGNRFLRLDPEEFVFAAPSVAKRYREQVTILEDKVRVLERAGSGETMPEGHDKVAARTDAQTFAHLTSATSSWLKGHRHGSRGLNSYLLNAFPDLLEVEERRQNAMTAYRDLK